MGECVGKEARKGNQNEPVAYQSETLDCQKKARRLFENG